MEIDYNAIVDDFNRRKAQAGRKVSDLFNSQPVRSLSSLFTPNEASAEVIPEDFRSRQILADIAKQGGQAASTVRMAQLLGDKVPVTASMPSWDEKVKDVITRKNPNATPTELAEYLNNFRHNVFGVYNWDEQRARVNPTVQGPNDPTHQQTMAHELGHFLVHKLNFRPQLEGAGVNEEDFADFLGGMTNPPQGHILRKLASEMFMRAQKPQE